MTFISATMLANTVKKQKLDVFCLKNTAANSSENPKYPPPPKCLSIGTLKTIDFPFVPNGKLIVLRCASI